MRCRTGKSDALLPAARQCADALVRARTELETVELLFDPRAQAGAPQSIEGGIKLEVLPNREIVVEAELL